MNWRLRLLMAGVSGFSLCSVGDGAEEGAEVGGGVAGGEAGGAEGEQADPDPDAEQGAEGEEGGEAEGAEGAAAAAEGEEGGEDGDPEPEGPKKVPFWKKRIDKLTAENARLREAAGSAAAEGGEAEPAASGKVAPTHEGYVNEKGERLYTQAEIDSMVQSRAQLAELNKRADKLFDAGKSKFQKTWEKRINAAGEAFGQDLARRTDFFDALTDLDNGADVYHELTGDLDEMADVLALPPTKLGMRLAEIALKLKAPKVPPVSKVPAPIEPLDEHKGDGAAAPGSSMADYEKDFNKRREARNG
jgi:hypothetical protein